MSDSDQMFKQEEKPLEIVIPNDVAFQLKILEFDKVIAENEAQVAEVKRQKAAFIFGKNLEVIKEKYKDESKKEA